MHQHQAPLLLLAILAGLSLPVLAADPVSPAAQEPKEAELQRLYREHIDRVNQGSVKFLGEQGARKVTIKFDTLRRQAASRRTKGSSTALSWWNPPLGRLGSRPAVST